MDGGDQNGDHRDFGREGVGRMRIAVFGIGAVGGCVAARLALAGADVAVVARGATLAAIREHGLTLRYRGTEQTAAIRAVADPAELGPQDAVIVCTKAYSLASAAPAVAPLLGPETAIVPTQNGIPWWYFHRAGPPFEGEPVTAVDPQGVLLRALPPERVVGCVTYVAASVPRPGVVEQVSSGRFVLGEPDGSTSARIEPIAAALRRGDFEIVVTDRIRDAVWMKLWGNVALNSVSALTLARVGEMATNPGTRRVMTLMMEEMRGVAGKLGVRLEMDVEARLDQAARLGGFKTSMLQDMEAGRPLEIDALVGAVSEFGRRLGVPTPTIDVVEALLRVRAATAG
jgi:2-dehydropantoate 2-reductase